MTHDELCPLSQPCWEELPHGYCGNNDGPAYCIHCQQTCICEQLALTYTTALRDAVEAVKTLPWSSETWQAHDERAAALAAINALGIKS